MGEFIAKYWLEFAFGIITAILSGLYARLAKRFKAEKLKNQAIENGVRDILRMQILDSYDKCKAQGGMISISRKDAIDSAYKSYIALCGHDGTITRVYEEIMEMPII